MSLSGKKILIGVSGGIAAYKVANLVRLLIKENAEVRVVMTPEAVSFITPLTLATLSKHPVYTDAFDPKTGQWVNHVDLGIWADLFVIAPLTANTLAKMANGFCDNLLLLIYLSLRCPTLLAPSMDLEMWEHPSVQENLQKIKNLPNHFILEPEHGELASGLVGKGRMAEPESILSAIQQKTLSNKFLQNTKILITAGPTYEKIDPVRFIGNFSTGKMGFALAEKAAQLGAEVFLVTGPVHLSTPVGVKRFDVTSAEEMLNICNDIFSNVNICIMSAAVADFKPKHFSKEKIKKSKANLNIPLHPTQDILAQLGSQKKNQFLLGFALETENELDNAILKLKSKNLDAIALNSLNDQGAGFANETNKITLIDHDENILSFGKKSKMLVAEDILNFVAKKLMLMQEHN